jgi:hypothetical protein
MVRARSCVMNPSPWASMVIRLSSPRPGNLERPTVSDEMVSDGSYLIVTGAGRVGTWVMRAAICRSSSSGPHSLSMPSTAV